VKGVRAWRRSSGNSSNNRNSPADSARENNQQAYYDATMHHGSREASDQRERSETADAIRIRELMRLSAGSMGLITYLDLSVTPTKETSYEILDRVPDKRHHERSINAYRSVLRRCVACFSLDATLKLSVPTSSVETTIACAI
jgi:hypothetical protein